MMFFIKFFLNYVCICVRVHMSVYMIRMRLEDSHGYWSSSTFHILFETALIGLCCNL